MAVPLFDVTPPRHSSAGLLRELRVAALGGGTGLPNLLRGLCAMLYGGVARDEEGIRSDQPFQHVIFNTSAISAELAARYAAHGAYPIMVTPRDLVEFERVGVRPLGVPLVSKDSTGKIRHHGGRLAAAVAACARLERRSAASG